MTSAPADTMTRVVIADSQPLCLCGIRSMLADAGSFEVAGEARCGSDTLEQLHAVRPNVAVLDPGMAGLHGLATLRQISRELPEVQVVVFSSLLDSTFIRNAVEAGARAYVSKQSAPECLLQALAVVRSGGFYADTAIAEILVGDRSDARRSGSCRAPRRDLTEREQDVFRLIALGFTNKEVAAKLNLTTKSVETYKSRASEKLAIRSRAKIVQYGMLQGWFSAPVA